jgi:hypothetical protein
MAWVWRLLVLAVVFWPAVAQSQDQAFSKFRVRRATGEMIQGIDGRLSESALTGRTAGGSDFVVPRSEIRDLEVQGGTKAVKWAVLGGLTGLGCGGLAILQVESDPTMELREERVAPMMIGVTVAGAVVGALIGSNRPTWKRYPLPSLTVGASSRRVMVTVRTSLGNRQ